MYDLQSLSKGGASNAPAPSRAGMLDSCCQLSLLTLVNYTDAWTICRKQTKFFTKFRQVTTLCRWAVVSLYISDYWWFLINYIFFDGHYYTWLQRVLILEELHCLTKKKIYIYYMPQFQMKMMSHSKESMCFNLWIRNNLSNYLLWF